MPVRTTSSSSSPDANNRLLRIPLERLHAHPANPNVMDEDRLARLAANIRRSGDYPPLVVRPHPTERGHYQILDGHQRETVLGRLGHRDALCYLWPCDDATALLLLSTLNALRGEEVVARRAALLLELQGLVPAEELAFLLPENSRQLADTIALATFDAEQLLVDLTAAATREAAASPNVVSFVLGQNERVVVEEAIQAALPPTAGGNRRGAALVAICSFYLRSHRA